MADDGIKIVHREETFNDHAVDELADVQAQCICRLQFGRCTLSECKNCSHHKHFKMCYNNMNDYDRARLESKISRKYSVYSSHAEGFMSYDRLKLYYGKFILIGLLCVLLIWVMCATGHAKEYKEFFTAADIASAPEPKMKSRHKDVYKDTEFAVTRILRMTRERITDVNTDGKTNCIDYSLTFKILWDRYYEPSDCIIIHNLNPNVGMAHLFVAVFDYKTMSYVDVEPWTDDLNKWQMYDVWKNMYDMYYNRYDKEKYWMGEVRRRIR